MFRRTEEWQAIYDRAAESDAAEIATLRAELADCKALIAMQHTRTLEADRAYQQAHGWPDTQFPDLGKLIEWLLGERRWYKVADRLPADEQLCLVYWPRRGRSVCTYQARYHADLDVLYTRCKPGDGPGFESIDFGETFPLKLGHITHWRPLPEEPQSA